ncbi:MAG: histidine phosphatase family protein [Caulobacterales bacterium]
MTRIVLVRHGHVEGIEPERFRGRADIPLSELGHKQAAAVAARIAAFWRPVRIFTSPLGRARDTGSAIGQATGAPCEIQEGLGDIDYGQWQWKTHEEVRAAEPALYDLWYAEPHLVRFPGGEALQDVVARTADVVRAMRERFPGQTVVLVGHDSVNRALLLQLLDQPLSAYWRLAQSPCGISEIEFDVGPARVLRVNETAHLEV